MAFALRSALAAALLLVMTPLVRADANRVLHLDGDGDYVQLPRDAFIGLEQATIEAWVRWSDFPYFSQWFAFGVDGGWQSLGVNHYYAWPTLQFYIYDREQKLYVAAAASNLPADEWCHMAAVSGAAGMKLYINGALVAENPYTGSFAAIDSTGDHYFGHSHWRDNFDFRGALDEVRVWSEARTAEQIRSAMGQRLRGDERGLVGLWNFDAGTADDLSPNGYHGKLMGDAHCVEEPLPSALQPPALLMGNARNLDGEALILAEVFLHDRRGQIARATTDAEGAYQLVVFGAGPFDVAARLEDQYGTWLQDIHLKPGERRRLDLELSPVPSVIGAVGKDT